MQRREKIIKHIISPPPAQGDALCLVEFPVDAEIDPALAVLFLSLRERREAAREERANVAVIAARGSVKLIRHKGESDFVGPVKSAQGLEESAAESGVTRR